MKDQDSKGALQTVSREDVRDFYRKAGETPEPGLCCPTVYDKSEIAHIPADVLKVSYGCGSPVTRAGLKGGETVLDLGAGGGVDCFIASKLVGKSGRVIGVDMTPEMVRRAEAGAGSVAASLGYRNTEFRLGVLEEVPVDAKSVDVAVSNCVVNLSPDKLKVFREMHRILKDGGRFVLSDIVSEEPVPLYMRTDRKLWGECISGALVEEEFKSFAKEAGFYGLEILSRTFYREVDGRKFWSLTLQGWKRGKGPQCVYVGQYATYLGPYSQVSDDDNHTYVRGVPLEVCTDTAVKLQNPPYAGRFIVTDPTKKKEDAACCTPSATNGRSCC